MLYAKKLVGALSLAFFATVILASPVPDGKLAPREDDELDPADIAFGLQAVTPPLPTIQDCKDHLNVAKDTSLFYSGPGGYAGKARQKIRDVANLKNYKILGMMWTDSTWQNQWQNDEQASKDFFNICSQAMAEASSGTVYVLLPPGKGTDWKKGTVWDSYEWPNLGSGVDKVIRINPDNTDEEVIKDTTAASNPPPAPPPAPEPAPAPAPPPVCSFHLRQWDYAIFKDTDGNERYEVEVRLLGNDKNEIGFQPKTKAGDSHPLGMTSALPYILVVTPESQNDYVQFAYGGEFWQSNGEFGENDVPKCSQGHWDRGNYPAVSCNPVFLVFFFSFPSPSLSPPFLPSSATFQQPCQCTRLIISP